LLMRMIEMDGAVTARDLPEIEAVLYNTRLDEENIRRVEQLLKVLKAGNQIATEAGKILAA